MTAKVDQIIADIRAFVANPDGALTISVTRNDCELLLKELDTLRAIAGPIYSGPSFRDIKQGTTGL